MAFTSVWKRIPPTLRFVNLAIMVHWLFALIRSTIQVLVRGERIATLPRQVGVTAVVTGASSGLGAATSAMLAQAGYHVVLAVRDMQKGRRVAEEILAQNSGASLEVRHLDLTEPSSIVAFAFATQALNSPVNASNLDATVLGHPLENELKRAAQAVAECRSQASSILVGHGISRDQRKDPGPPITLLVHCAAVLAGGLRERCGQAETLLVNHTGPLALSLCLLPSLMAVARERGEPSRLVQVGSFTHFSVRPAWLATCLQGTDGAFQPAKDYCCTKALAMLSAKRLHASSAPQDVLLACTVDPGAVQSELVREWPSVLQVAFRLGLTCLGLLHTPVEATAAVSVAVQATHAMQLNDSLYFAQHRGRVAVLAPDLPSVDACGLLWKDSCRLALRLLWDREVDRKG